jgi:predicted permease
MTQDLRYAVRLLWRNPLFALTAALVLSIGIGATTTIFTVANGLLLRAPAGVGQPDTLVDIYGTQEGNLMSEPMISYKEYVEIRQRTTKLDGVYAFGVELQPISLRGTEGAERVFGNLVSTNYFSVLGVPAAAGRVFSPRDSEEEGASPLVVLSHQFWMRRFNGDRSVIGTTLTLNGQSFTVIGIAPESFRGTSVVAPDMWVPAGMASVIRPGMRAEWVRTLAGGRLKADASIAEANAEVMLIGHTIRADNPLDRLGPGGPLRQQHGRRGLRLTSASSIPGNLRYMLAGFLGLLIALVSVVLIIACANITGVLLARATARRREIAVRLAIGAGRARLIRQLLTETVVLFLLGGVAGVLLARVLTSMVTVLLPAFPVPVNLSLPLDGRVIAFAMIVSSIAAILSGLAPALHASKTDVLSALNADAQGPVDRLRLRSAFVVAQVALSIMLVVSAGTLVQAVNRVALQDRGFDPHGVEIVSLDLALSGYNNTTGPLFIRTLADRVRALPGVTSASIADTVPDGGVRTMIGINEGLVVPGFAPPSGLPFLIAGWTGIEPDYFATLKIPLVAGRDFTAADRADAARVVILPESTARRLWPGQDAVGKFLFWQKGRADLPGSGPVQMTKIQVVGIVRDANRGGPTRPDAQQISLYAPLQQRYQAGITLFVRTGDGHRPINELRTLLTSMDPNLPIITERALEDQLLAPPVMQLQVASSVSGTVGLIGLLLAAIGLYGVTAYMVVQRTREIGIRIALGAERGDVVGMVLRQGMTLMAIGSGVGLLLALGVGRLLRARLFGLPALDPITFGAATLLFAAIGLIACYIPARRATKIDAMEALRYE